MRQANFGYIVRKKSYYQPDDVAIVEQTTREEHTYGELERRSNSIAAELEARGVGEGDRVSGLFRNSAEFFELFFATCKLGAVLAPFNYRLSTDELAYLNDDADPELFVYEGVFEDTAAALPLDGVSAVRIGEPDGEKRVAADDWDTFYQPDPDTVEVADGFE
ncbi:MAG: fatty-acyl-CoA synthase, partial [Natronomonas sp.]